MKPMKKLTALLLALIFVFSPLAGLPLELPVFAATSGTTGSCTWTLDGTVLTISGNGAMANYTSSSSALPWGTSITEVIIEDGVTKIGSYAFYNCNSLTSVTIPDSVTSIGSYAFYYCYSLPSVTIPDSVTSIGSYAFYNCNSLTSIAIPDSVTSIGSSAFWLCEALTSITIPDGVTSIGNWVFRECDALTSVTIPNSVTSIGERAFSGCSSLTSITIPDSVTSIGSHAFSSCDSLTSITIPDSVTSIGDGTFYNCTSLEFISIPDSVTSIGSSAFENCSSLTSITIPGSVTSIGKSAFYNCDSLKSLYINDLAAWCTVSFENSFSHPFYSSGSGDLYINGVLVKDIVIPEDVTSIGDYAFHYCTSLTSVTIPDGVTSIGDDAFSSCSSLTSVTIPGSVTNIGSSAFSACSSLSSVTIPEGVTSIGKYTFSSCSKLTSITIPDSVTSIGDYAFYNCTSLTSISIGNGVTSIGSYAFSGCSSLTSVTIPDSVTSIGDYAFYDCDSLTSVTIGNSVTSIGSYAFYNCSSLTSVTIPDGVTSIGDHAFQYCTSLTSIAIPDSVTSIGSSAFWLCEALTSITIPDGVTSIGNWVFRECDALTSVTIPNSVTSIGNSAFYNCKKITSITIPDSVTSIGEDAFNFCYSLTDVWYTGDRSAVANITIGTKNSYLTSATWHYIDSICDEDCNACGAANPMAHSFDNACDATCNTCGKERTVPDHIYDNACDTTCNECGKVREVPDHVYSNKADATCNVCGFERKLPYDAYGTTGSCYWYVEGDVLTIFGSGAMANYSALNPSPWGKAITEVVIEDGVTSIGADAFSYNTALTSITIPKSVTSIGTFAFDGATGLSDIYYEGTEENKTSISIGNSNAALTSATWHCNFCAESDTKVHIYDNACDAACNICGNTRSVPDHTYDNACDTDCNVCGTIRTIPHVYDNACDTTCNVCGSIREVPDHVFDNACDTTCNVCGSIREVPGHVYDNRIDTTCNECGFIRTLPYDDYGTTGDCFWTLEGTVLTISGNGAMANYPYSSTLPWGRAITEVVIEDGVTSIGDSAFEECPSLTSVSIPKSVTSVGYAAFARCTSLISVYITDLAAWCALEFDWDAANSPLYYTENFYLNGNLITDLVIPDGVTSIGSFAFGGYSKITSVTIPDSVTSIGYEAFFLCDSLTSITIPDSVTSIGVWAFDGTAWYDAQPNGIVYAGKVAYSVKGTCPSEVVLKEGTLGIAASAFLHCDLTSITIPNTVTTIERDAFCYCGCCSALTDVWYEGTEETKAAISIGTDNENLTSATWHYIDSTCDEDCNACGAINPMAHTFDNGCDTTCNGCGFVRVTLHTPVNGVCTECGQKAVVPVSAQLVLDKYIGVKFYFNKTDVDEDFTFLVTLPGRDEPLAEGAFSDLIEDGKYYVLSFNGIGLSDFNTEFTLSGKTLWDPNAGRYNSVYKLATIGANHYTDGSKADKLFKSIVDLGKAAVGEDTEYDLTYKAETPASSGQGPEEGASLRFTGKNLLMNDTIALRLYGEADTAEAIEGIKVIFNNKYNVTRMCDVSAPVYNEAKGKYTFTVDVYFSTSTMEEAITITVNDGNGLRCLELNDRIDWIAQTILAKQPGNTLAKQILIYIQSINDFVRREDAVITPSKPGTETELGGGVEV